MVKQAMKFLDKRTKEIKNVYSIEFDHEKALVKFNENGKTYAYSAKNIEIVDEAQGIDQNRIYQFKQPCYKCGQATTVYTYIVFSDNENEDVVFPWDKRRLLKNQNICAHLQDPSIEYYGLKVIGGNDALDEMLAEKFPDRIKMQYSKTQNRYYPMNVCEHCKAKQGEYFIYRRVNEKIKNMEKMEMVCDTSEF